MSVKNYTNYNFSCVHGITGTLAADPTFLKTKDGKPYVRLPVFCKAMDTKFDDSNVNDQKVVSDTDEISLVAYVKVFDLMLLKQVENIKQGYFVNFKFDRIVFGLGKDTEKNNMKATAFLVANAIEVKHIPNKFNENKFDQRENDRGMVHPNDVHTYHEN